MGDSGNVGQNHPEKAGFRHRTDKRGDIIMQHFVQAVADPGRQCLVWPCPGLFTTPTPRKCTLHLRDFYPRVRRFLANLRPQKSPEHSEEAALEHFPSAWVSSPQNLFSPAPQVDPELLSTAIRQPALHLKKIFKTYSHSQNCKLLFASYIPNQLPPDTLVGEFPCFLNPIGGVS